MPEKIDPNLGLSYGWDEGEDGWSAGMDKNLTRLGAFVGLEVIDIDLADPPGGPAEGDRYIVAAPATGAWAGQEDNVAVWLEGAWTFHPATRGMRAFVGPDLVVASFNGSTWIRGERLVRIVDVPGVLHGQIGVQPDGSGCYIANPDPDGNVEDVEVAALFLDEGRSSLRGHLEFPALTHSDEEGRHLVVSPTGQVYLGPPVANLWSQDVTDASDYTTLGSGGGTGPWVELSGLTITLAQTIEASHIISQVISLYLENQSGNQSGAIEVIVVESGSPPGGGDTPDLSFSVAAGEAGAVAESFTRLAPAQILAGVQLVVYARRTGGSGNFAVHLLGSVEPHRYAVMRLA